MKKAAKKPKKAPKVPEADPVDVVAIERWELPAPTVSCSVNIAVPAATVSVAARAPVVIGLSIGVPADIDPRWRNQIINTTLPHMGREILTTPKGRPKGAGGGPQRVTPEDARLVLRARELRPKYKGNLKGMYTALASEGFGEEPEQIRKLLKRLKPKTDMLTDAELQAIADAPAPPRKRGKAPAKRKPRTK
jgi:hypothetical protein